MTTTGFPVPTTVRDLSELYLTWDPAHREETPNGPRWSMPTALLLPDDQDSAEETLFTWDGANLAERQSTRDGVVETDPWD
ncbi:DUF6042 family protein [Streptomyces venezuelae]|uniref:DUF6042 family protein n=1 Tax=Streptomyces venezuelae TaxID=54571 RepID=UPI003F540E1A